MMKYYFSLIFAALMSLNLMAQYTVENLPNPRQYVAEAYTMNPDEVMTLDEEAMVHAICTKIDKAVGVEVAVVTIRSIADADAFDFSLELFNKWGIGNKEKNTGVLILLVTESRDIQIRTGGGIEGILTDAVCSDIIWDTIAPYLREERWGEGMIAGVNQIGRIVTRPEAQAELLLDYKRKPIHEDPYDILSFISLLTAIIAFIKRMRVPKCPKCKKRQGKLIKTIVLQKPTYTAQGKGERHYRCEKCGETWITTYTIAKLVESSGSSYSGGSHSYGGGYSGSSHHSGGSFGGGRSFGGGAGGKF